ncbi:MAG: hypothetical protein IPN94_18285 [Sphingobacteriales bacterium]|nr:hypothetical protein [Sphingobacteriales bacterium]
MLYNHQLFSGTMHDSKLLKLLETILTDATTFGLTRRQQQNRLRRFIASPYFVYDKDKNVLPLFDYLVQYLPKFSHPNLARQKVAQHLFPERAFDDKVYQDLRRTMADLNYLLDKYIVSTSIEQDKQESILPLLDFYTRHDVDSQTTHAQLIQMARHANEQSPQNANFYYNAFKLSSQEGAFMSLQPANEEQNLPQIQKTTYNLDIFFILSKLDQYCHYLTFQKIRSVDNSLPIDPNILQFIRESKYMELPIVKIYYNAFMLLYDPNEANYFMELKQLLQKESHLLDKMDLHNLHTRCENYCTLNILSGNNNYRRQLFELYQEQLESGIIYIDGCLDIRKFKNIVTLGVWLRDFDFTATFIEQNKDRILSQYQQEVYHYCLAYLYFGTQDYDRVNEHLNLAQQQKRYYNITYRTDSHKLQIKMYYECNEQNLLNAKLNTFTAFVRNNLGTTGNSQLANQNFVKIVRKLLNIIELPKLYGTKNTNQQKTEQLITEIQQLLQHEAYIAERPWIVDKLNELKHNYPNTNNKVNTKSITKPNLNH